MKIEWPCSNSNAHKNPREAAEKEKQREREGAELWETHHARVELSNEGKTQLTHDQTWDYDRVGRAAGGRAVAGAVGRGRGREAMWGVGGEGASGAGRRIFNLSHTSPPFLLALPR